MTKDKLIGKFFHTFDDAHVLRYQGQIEAALSAGYYLVQLYDWLVGLPNAQQIFHLADMKGWDLYDDKDYWRQEGDRRSRADMRRDEHEVTGAVAS